MGFEWCWVPLSKQSEPCPYDLCPLTLAQAKRAHSDALRPVAGCLVKTIRIVLCTLMFAAQEKLCDQLLYDELLRVLS